MKKLILLRGPMGSGKSSFIKDNDLEKYTISVDAIRKLYYSPKMTIDGFRINQKNMNKIFKTFNNILKERMKNGDLTIIDAMHLTENSMNEYKKLSNKYRYRVYVIDFQASLEDLLLRNKNRNPLDFISEKTIKKSFKSFRKNVVPNYIKKITKEEFFDILEYKPIDFNHYEKIYHIGDIHGCFSPLNQFFKEKYSEENLYIFVGDYLDRGIQNLEVLNFLYKIKNYKNVILLEGNHEKYLRRWSNNKEVKSKEFNINTLPAIENFSKKKVRNLLSKMWDVVYYEYEDKKVLVSHGGIPFITKELSGISSSDFIGGVGRYSADIDKIFTKNNLYNDKYQIHGHRNKQKNDMDKYFKSFNLQEKIEHGENLRVLELSKEGFNCFYYKNDVFKLPDNLRVDKSVKDMIEVLREDKLIREKKFGDISSFNYSREAFYDYIWNKKTIKARGLFVNTQKNKIVARSYPKFFNINENKNTKIETLKKELKFPLNAYIKEDGFLALLSVYKGEFFFTSKSTIKEFHVDLFKNIFFEKTTKNQRKEIKKYLKENDVTFIFEAIDVINDPHLTDYDERKIVLLDIVKNKILFEKYSFEELIEVSNELNLNHKKLAFELNDWSSFFTWYQKVVEKGYIYNKEELIEGFVVEDRNSFQVKIKTYYHLFWKTNRRILDNFLKDKEIDLKKLSKANISFYLFLKEHNKEDFFDKSILEIKKMFIDDAS